MPVAFVALALVTGAILGIALGGRSTPAPDVFDMPAANALRAGLLWCIAYVAAIVALVWNALVGIAIIRAHMTRRETVVATILTGTGMLIGGLASISSSGDPRSVWVVIDAATGVAIHKAAWLSGTLAGGGAVLIVAAFVALGTRSETPVAVAQLRRRIAETRLFLFSTAALLAAALTSIYLTITWPLSLPVGAGSSVNPDVLTHLAVTITLASGIAYTGLLVVLFVPVAILHETWIEESWEAAHEQASAQDRSVWLSENGLDRSTASSGAEIVVLAAPWLASLVLPRL